MEEIIGRKFLNSKLEEVDPQEIFKCKIICLFFTASWCTPCEIFSKELIEIYNEGNQGEKLLEIIQVSYEKPEIKKTSNSKTSNLRANTDNARTRRRYE